MSFPIDVTYVWPISRVGISSLNPLLTNIQLIKMRKLCWAGFRLGLIQKKQNLWRYGRQCVCVTTLCVDFSRQSLFQIFCLSSHKNNSKYLISGQKLWLKFLYYISLWSRTHHTEFYLPYYWLIEILKKFYN